jgi:hypothetical protein
LPGNTADRSSVNGAVSDADRSSDWHASRDRNSGRDGDACRNAGRNADRNSG